MKQNKKQCKKMAERNLPDEILIEIIKRCDLPTKTKFLQISDTAKEAKRQLRPQVKHLQVLFRATSLIGVETKIEIETIFEHNYPKIITRYEIYSGKRTLRAIEYFNEKGELHRGNGPALQYWYHDGTRSINAWYINGDVGKVNIFIDDTIQDGWNTFNKEDIINVDGLNKYKYTLVKGQ